MMKFRLAIMAAALVLLFGLAGYSWYASLHAHRVVTSQSDPAVRIGGPFRLTNQDGKVVTEAALRGKWSLVFFGYTYCPEVCPLTLQSLARTQDLLGDKAEQVQIVFITVDPARDTPANLKAYLASHGFPRGVTGLTGTQAQIDAVLKAYRAEATRKDVSGGYDFSHTAYVYLMNPQGEFAEPLSIELGPEKNAGLIRDAMRGN